jgi:hypothetical protein
VNVRFGSTSTLLAEATRPFMSAMPPIQLAMLGSVVLPPPSKVDRTEIRVTNFSSIKEARRFWALI